MVLPKLANGYTSMNAVIASHCFKPVGGRVLSVTNCDDQNQQFLNTAIEGMPFGKRLFLKAE